MIEQSLAKLFEHNNWANQQIIQACLALTEEQLDAEPVSATRGSIRATLTHLVASQKSYLRTLTLPLEERRDWFPAPAFADLLDMAVSSGEALLSLARGEIAPASKERLQTRDNFTVEPWVLMVQIINHATEHREQIKSMLTALGIEPPDIDGWSFGQVEGALVPIDPSK